MSFDAVMEISTLVQQLISRSESLNIAQVM